MAFKSLVTFCLLGYVVLNEATNDNQGFGQPPTNLPQFPLPLPPLLYALFNQMRPVRPTQPSEVPMPAWMKDFVFHSKPTAPVPPTPVNLPEWMTTGQFPHAPTAPVPPTPVQLPEWMTTGKLPNMPTQPVLTSSSVLNTKAGDHLEYNGVAVRSSDDGVNSGTSMATNDNGKVEVAQDGSAPPDLNKPLPSLDPNARFASFATSSYSSSNTVNGKTVTVGGSDTKVNNDGKIDAESIHVVQKDGEEDNPEEDKENIESEEPETKQQAPIKRNTNQATHSSSSSSSSQSSTSDSGAGPKFTSTAVSSFSSSNNVNGVVEKASGSSSMVNDNGEVESQNSFEKERLNLNKEDDNSKDNENDNELW